MSFKYTILVITDSLGFPRAEPELVPYEQSYIALLKGEFAQCDFIHQGYGGATIGDLYNRTAYFHHTVRPDLVIIQSGIVDCAPRALTLVEQQIVARLPLVSGMLVGLVKKYSRQMRKARRLTYTPIAAFEACVKQFEALYAKVCWIGILPASSAYEAKLEGIGGNVARYNAVLQQGRFVSTADFDSADVMTDHHHLSLAGHRKMADRLGALLRSEVPGLASAPAPLPAAYR